MLLLASSVCGLFKWRQFEPEVILLAVGWYLRFSLSYRDVEELLAERGLRADHVTVWRWVQRYAPELDRRLRKRLKATNDSWRADETYIRVKGKWVYLYRAVDSTGATIDFLLSAKRDAAAAERFLAKALSGANHSAPRVMNTDKHAGYPPAIAQLKVEGALKENCRHRPVQYLNNVLEQDPPDHRTPGPRESAFSLLLGSLAHNCRLQGDPYDPQTTSVLQWGGCGGRSTAPPHSRAVRGDELNCRSSTPTFGSTTKLQHILERPAEARRKACYRIAKRSARTQVARDLRNRSPARPGQLLQRDQRHTSPRCLSTPHAKTSGSQARSPQP
jgi:IS6 family transposase